MNALFKFLSKVAVKLFSKYGKLIVTTILNFILEKLFSKKKRDRGILIKKSELSSHKKTATSYTAKTNGVRSVKNKTSNLLPNNNRKSKRGRRIQYIGKKRIIHSR